MKSFDRLRLLLIFILAASTAVPDLAWASRLSSRIYGKGQAVAALATYDTSIGNGVDNNGLAYLPLRSGAHQYFVNTSTGSDARSCATAESSTTPKATLASAWACVTNGSGDQVLLAEGQTFTESFPTITGKDGFSAVYPTVLQSYDPADAANAAKYGKGTSTRPRLVFSAASTPGLATYFAVRGLDIGSSSDTSDLGLNFTASGTAGSYFLIENNIFRYTGMGFFNQTNFTSNLIIRRNAVDGPYSTTSNTGGQCFFLSKNTGIVMEDNVLNHCAWKKGALRSDTCESGGLAGTVVGVCTNPAVFRHAIYVNVDTTATLRRNMIIAPAMTGCSCRGPSLTAYDNLIIDAPIAMAGGYPDATNLPTGSLIHYYNNTIIGSIPDGATKATQVDPGVSSAGPIGGRSWAFAIDNAASGSLIDYNLVVRGRDQTRSAVLRHAGSLDQASSLTFSRNKAMDWGTNTSAYVENVGAYAATRVTTTYSNNVWDNPTSGTNTTNGGAFTGYADEDALAVAMGSANVTALATAAVANPIANWALNGKSLAGTSFSMTWAP